MTESNPTEVEGIEAARKQYGASLHFVTRVEHQRTLARIALLERQAALMRSFVQESTYPTERVERPCNGSHTQYSSMAFDAVCPKCGYSEDGPGGTLVTYEPTSLAKKASETLAAVDMLEASVQINEKGIKIDTDAIKKLGDQHV